MLAESSTQSNMNIISAWVYAQNHNDVETLDHQGEDVEK
jgi:hypothetical protein